MRFNNGVCGPSKKHTSIYAQWYFSALLPASAPRRWARASAHYHGKHFVCTLSLVRTAIQADTGFALFRLAVPARNTAFTPVRVMVWF
jgi:hypothetical protein